MRSSFSAMVLAFAILVPTLARAQASENASENASDPAPDRLLTGFAALDRPVGMAEGGVGVLTLPAAEVCVERSTGCKQGDVSFAVEAWQLYRPKLRWAFGAGLLLGLIPTATPPRQDQEPPGVERDHTRSYMTVEGMVRYYPYVGEHLEVWVGAIGGLVVVSDRFTVSGDLDERALAGSRGVTIRTEGGSLGAGVGFAYELTRRWAFVGNLRYAEWFLPRVPAKDPLGTEASLAGRNAVFSLAFGIAYRVDL
jgi:hypothetical protein